MICVHPVKSRSQFRPRRRGAATLDYVLTISVLFTMSAFVVLNGKKIMQLVYDFTGFFLAWPFM